MHPVVKDVLDWISTKPASINTERVVLTDVVFKEYNAWAAETGRLQQNAISIGMALRQTIPGIYNRRIMRNRKKFREYVLPYDPKIESDDIL